MSTIISSSTSGKTDPMPQHPEEFGEALRQRRESLGVTLQEAAQKTRIRMRYLHMIEEDNFRELPPKIYTECYVRQYAEFLALDGYAFLEQFRQFYPDFATRSSDAMAATMAERIVPTGGGLSKSMGWWVVLSCLASVACYEAWYRLNQYPRPFFATWSLSAGDDSQTQEPLAVPYAASTPSEASPALLSGVEADLPEAASGAAVRLADTAVTRADTSGTPVMLSTSSSSPSAAASVVPTHLLDDSNVVLLAKGETWVKLFDAQRMLLSEQHVRSGDTVFVPDKQGVHLATDHPERLEVYRNGQLSSLVLLQPTRERPYAAYHVQF